MHIEYKVFVLGCTTKNADLSCSYTRYRDSEIHIRNTAYCNPILWVLYIPQEPGWVMSCSIAFSMTDVRRANLLSDLSHGSLDSPCKSFVMEIKGYYTS